MTLHRFMSKREYDALMTGEVLRNETDHGAMGLKTDSVGFCFFPEPPDEVAMAAAILKKHRCRSRKRIQNTIKSLNPKMSMEAARALLEQMEARGFVIIDAQGHATFT